MPPRSMRAVARYYYFAYGSNMSLKQMAERCPSSLLMGRGHIDGFRWQINERGVANIVESTGEDFVEGLVYQIGAEDRRKLDRSEGVARGYYDDDYLPVQLTPLEGGGLKTFHAAREMEEPGHFGARGDRRGSHSSHEDWPSFRSPVTRNRDQQPALGERRLSQMSILRHGRDQDVQTVDALVYLSRRYMADGVTRQEYVGRMEKAVSDARRLGLSDRFLNFIDRITHQVAWLEPPSDFMPPRDGPVSQGQPSNPGQSYGRYDAMSIDQTDRDFYEEVQVIERVPRYSSQISTTVHLIGPHQQEHDDYYQRLSRAPSPTREPRRPARRSPIPSANSQKWGRGWFGSRGDATWVQVGRTPQGRRYTRVRSRSA